MDSFDIARALTSKQDPNTLRARYGTLVALYSDGTADVLIDGSVTPQRLINWSDGEQGSRCMVAMKGTDWLILSASGGGGAIEVADFIVEISGNRDPSAGWVWEKRASGEAKATKVVTRTPGYVGVHPNSYGWGYGWTPYEQLPEGLFLTSPINATAHIDSYGNNLFTVSYCDCANNQVRALIVSAQTTTAQSMTIRYEVHGRWSAEAVETPQKISYRPTYELTAVPVPVGGIYETLDPRDPTDIWPGTAWEALGAGRQTIGAGDGYAAGTTGGNNTLTAEQMPSHTHDQSLWAFQGSVSSGTHYGLTYQSNTGARYLSATNAAFSSDWYNTATGGNQPHTHPYIVVYRWKRLANIGAVEELNLQEIAEELQCLRAAVTAATFVYTATKQDTGRTTDDGYIIWGQKFRGNITIAASTLAEVTLISGLPTAARLIDMWGWWRCYAAGMIDTMLVGGGWTTGYVSGGIRRSSGIIAFGSIGLAARNNSAYEVYVDWTDGTLR